MKPAQVPQGSRPHRQRGLTLVELMVSLTIGMMVVLTIGYVYLGASSVFRSLDASSRIQENVRYAFERVSFDVRMAGFPGCSYRTRANVLNPPAGWPQGLFDTPLMAYREGATFPSDVSGVARGDGLTLIRADNSREYIVQSHNPNAAQLQLTTTHDIQQGELLVITDCSHAALFQMTNVNNNNTISTVVHNTGNTTSPGNCTKGLGLPVNCANPNGTDYTFPPGSRIFRLHAVTYYIGTNAAGEPALFRQRLGLSGTSATTAAEEVIDGIENLQVMLGVDTSATPDGVVDTYVRPSQLAATAPGATASEQWARVLALRVHLLAASTMDQQVSTQIQPYFFDGASTTPTDRRMRKAFTTTIAIRNRL